MSSDADIVGQLSRIFETHSFQRGQENWELENLLENLEKEEQWNSGGGSYSPAKGSYSPAKSAPGSPNRFSQSASFPVSPSLRSPGRQMTTPSLNIDRPKPAEVWERKMATQRGHLNIRPTHRLSSEQWDRLVQKMHAGNRVKQSAMIREQNSGLAHELGGYLFKPRINQTSLDLSATMKSLQHRMPEMIAEHEKELETKRKEAAEAEMASCTFQPTRTNAHQSDLYLQRAGRAKSTPEDFMRYEKERLRRIDARRQIVRDVESKDLTFKPQIGEKSLLLQEKLLQNNVYLRDAITKTSVVAVGDNLNSATLHRSARAANALPVSLSQSLSPDSALQYVDGPTLVIESEHPYRHNCDECTAISVPNAVSYKVSFSEDTRTEPVHDFVKFYADETRTDYFGASKYSGGANGTPSNWPGQRGRPVLLIPATRFVVHFKSNGSINDWGFRMHVVPILLVSTLSTGTDEDKSTVGVPVISETGRLYRHTNGGEPVHDRLYRKGVDKMNAQQDSMADLLQNKLKLSLKPWEVGTAMPRTQSRTHLPKTPISDCVEEMCVEDDLFVLEHFEGDGQFVDLNASAGLPNGSSRECLTIVEYDDSLGGLWKALRTA